jgi:hypothetical protein
MIRNSAVPDKSMCIRRLSAVFSGNGYIEYDSLQQSIFVEELVYFLSFLTIRREQIRLAVSTPVLSTRLHTNGENHAIFM